MCVLRWRQAPCISFIGSHRQYRMDKHSNLHITSVCSLWSQGLGSVPYWEYRLPSSRSPPAGQEKVKMLQSFSAIFRVPFPWFSVCFVSISLYFPEFWQSWFRQFRWFFSVSVSNKTGTWDWLCTILAHVTSFNAKKKQQRKKYKLKLLKGNDWRTKTLKETIQDRVKNVGQEALVLEENFSKRGKGISLVV